MLPRGAGVLDGQAKMKIARVCGRFRVRPLVRRLTIEQLEGDSARQIEERGIDRDAGNADDFSEIRPVEGRAPARGNAKEGFPTAEAVAIAPDRLVASGKVLPFGAELIF